MIDDCNDNEYFWFMFNKKKNDNECKELNNIDEFEMELKENGIDYDIDWFNVNKIKFDKLIKNKIGKLYMYGLEYDNNVMFIEE